MRLESVAVRIAPEAGQVERSAAELLRRRLGAQGIAVFDGASAHVTLRTDQAVAHELGAEGYVVSVQGDSATVAGGGPNGVLYGAGCILHALAAAGGEWRLPAEMRGRPALPLRTMYFADHMGNWYAHASAEEVRDYLAEMALWGYNELMTCLEVRPGETFDDSVARVKALEAYARTLGMRAGNVIQSNTSFTPPPPGTKAEPGPVPGPYDVCPSKPGASDFIVDDKRTFVSRMLPFDFSALWPYDGGGCSSADCAPWARTYLDLSERIAREVLPGVEVRASAWFFDEPENRGEDDALFTRLAAHPHWFRHIYAGASQARRWLAAGRTLPEPYRVLLFPDTSMFDGIPWGGRGANPGARRFTAELRDCLQLLDGAAVYSEGRYDDVNKVVWAQLLWNTESDPHAMLAEYARVYLGADVAEDAAALLLAVEDGMAMLPDTERWRRGMFHPEWDEAAAAIEARLDAGRAASWRWQMIRARTRIEMECARLSRDGDDEAERQRIYASLREVYEPLQRRLNLHDPERSLPTWIYAPVEQAVPYPITWDVPV